MLELKNGAKVFEAIKGKVLAKFNEEYVVWSYSVFEGNAKADCYWGHYFKDDLTAASKYFDEVTK
ncbi:MAG: hypothetical protein ACTSQ9_06230 [Candidatus Hodarchaeales archaeon]